MLKKSNLKKKNGSSTVSQLLERQRGRIRGEKKLPAVLPISLLTAPNRYKDAQGNRNL